MAAKAPSEGISILRSYTMKAVPPPPPPLRRKPQKKGAIGPGKTYATVVPPLPQHYQARPELEARIRTLLLTNATDASQGLCRTVALTAKVHGSAG